MSIRILVEILAGPNVGENREFDEDQILIGRGSQCQLQLSSPHVSRQQCELRRQDGQVVLENLGTVNITYLNDRPIERVYVSDGDLITFCDVAMRVRVLQPQAQRPPEEATVAFADSPAGPEAPLHHQGEPTPIVGPRPPAPADPMRGPEPDLPSTQQWGGRPASPQTAPPMPPPPAMPGPMPTDGRMSCNMGAVGRAPGPMPGLVPGALPPGMPGNQGGHAHGMPTAPPQGMPAGLPPGAPSTGGSGASVRGNGVQSARKGGPRKKAAGNIQMVRNIVLAVSGVLLLFCFAFVLFTPKKSGKKMPHKGTASQQAQSPADAAADAAAEEDLPHADRRDRTDEEIISEAERLFGIGSTYLREFQIADENLWTSMEYMRRAKAEINLVPKANWPDFASEIDVQIARANKLLDKEYSNAKLNYVRERQSGHYERGMAEMDRIIRMTPDRNNEKHKYARKQQKVLRSLMAGGGKTGPLDR